MKTIFLKTRLSKLFIPAAFAVALCAPLCVSFSHAQTPASSPTQATAPAAPTTEQRLKKLFEERDGFKIDSVQKTPYMNLYEIRIGAELLYTDEKGDQFIIGEIIDAKKRVNVTQQRVAELQRIKFSDLPLDLAVKNVRGNGKRQIAVFEDPNCGYCKRFQKTLSKMDDVTVYTFLVGILSADSRDKAQGILCAKDRVKAHQAWMLEGAAPANAKCDEPFNKSMELARKLGVESTPTIYLANGRRIAGAISQEDLEKRLAEIK